MRKSHTLILVQAVSVKKIKTDFSQDDPLASEGEIDYQKCFSFSRDYSFGEESYED